MAKGKCEFTTEDLGEHGTNVSKWLTDNCAKIGEAIDALVHEDLVGSKVLNLGNRSIPSHMDMLELLSGLITNLMNFLQRWPPRSLKVSMAAGQQRN